MSHVKKYLAVAALALLVACGSDGVSIVADFPNSQNFKSGTPVYFENHVVGKVTAVDQSGQGAKVTLSLQPEAAEQMKGNMAAVVNRLRAGAPLELYNQVGNTAEPLQDGQSIRGLDSMVQLGAWMVGDAIQLGSSTLSDYVNSFQEYLSSDEFESDKAVVKQQIDTARAQASAAIENVESELTAAAESLLHSEQLAVESMQELSQELAPLVESLAGEGAQLATELQNLAESLQQHSDGQSPIGAEFLNSLMAALERINQAVENGAGVEPNDVGDTP